MTTRRAILKSVPQHDLNHRALCALEVVTAIADLFKFVSDVETLDPKTLPAIGYHMNNLCDEIAAGLKEGAA